MTDALMGVPLSDRLRWGPAGPPNDGVYLAAGVLSCHLDGAELVDVSVDGQRVLRRIYVAVRDQHWNTPAGKVVSSAVEQNSDGFSVNLVVEHVTDEVDFIWSGVVVGSVNGVLSFTFEGAARRPFLKNRIGFCVLHGVEWSGRGVEVVTEDGVHRARFPDRISPHQPFLGVRGFYHDLGGDRQVKIILEGDEFETEDERNWSDAAFKTYCTPLKAPIPVLVSPGERITQNVTVATGGRLSNTVGVTPVVTVSKKSRTYVVHLGAVTPHHLPGLGLVGPGGARRLAEPELEALKALNLGHLRAVVDLREAGWRTALISDQETAGRIGAPMELEVIVDEGAPVTPLLSYLDPQSVARILVFSATTHVTTKRILQSLSDLAADLGSEVLVGGGSRTSFAEFNRAELPVELMRIAGFPISPQVHRFDIDAITTSVGVQSMLVESARALIGDMPMTVGPITLLPRFNPLSRRVGSGSEISVASAASGPSDQRQASLFAAAWTLASIEALARSGVSYLTYFETVGPRGVLHAGNGSVSPRSGTGHEVARLPVWHLLAALGQYRAADLAEVRCDNEPNSTLPGGRFAPGIKTLGLVTDNTQVLYLANLGLRATSVEVHFPGASPQQARILDLSPVESSPGTTAHEDVSWDRLPSPKGASPLRVDLAPCSVVEVIALH